MEEHQLQEVIERGFKDLRAELNERFTQVHAELDERFTQVHAELDERFTQVHVEFDEKFAKVDSQLAELRRDVKKAGDDAHGAHIAIEGLRHDLSIFGEAEALPLEQRVSALEVRVTKLEKKRSGKKSGTAAESRKRS